MLYISDSEKTFEYQDELPSLPVPDLQQSIDKYLKSVEALVEGGALAHTRKLAVEFGSGVGKQLQDKLLSKATHTRNWIESWWEDYTYLMPRTPTPLINGAGPAPFFRSVYPPKNGTQVERAAFVMHLTAVFWDLLRREQIRVERSGKTILCMNQYRRVFNTARVPGMNVDRIKCAFKTLAEGSCSEEFAVICQSRVFMVPAKAADGRLFTPPEFWHQLQCIRAVCDSKGPGPDVGSLSSDDRTKWYLAQSRLKELDKKNALHFQRLEESIIVFILDDSATPSTATEMVHEGVCCGPENRFVDKNQIVVFPNGTFSLNCEHSPLEIVVVIWLIDFLDIRLREYNGQWPGTPEATVVLPQPEELEFTVDEEILCCIQEAKVAFNKRMHGLHACFLTFSHFGKKALKIAKVHPDIIIQLAVQLAYYRMHMQFAPTYETASARKYYHGRTETVRSCTVEAVEWMKAMADVNASTSSRFTLLVEAAMAHGKAMQEASNMQGFDRHLLGLQILALEEGLPVPELFLDPSWQKTGGGGNFVLSSSLAGFTGIVGCVPPMCNNGYGIFYSIADNYVNFAMTNWLQFGTSSEQLFEHICSALLEIRELAQNSVQAVSKM